jgi:hypothetical protein
MNDQIKQDKVENPTQRIINAKEILRACSAGLQLLGDKTLRVPYGLARDLETLELQERDWWNKDIIKL